MAMAEVVKAHQFVRLDSIGRGFETQSQQNNVSFVIGFLSL